MTVTELAGYQVVSILGTGANSTIYVVRAGDGLLYALKHVQRQSPADQKFLKQAICEHNVSSQFNHPSLRRSYKLIKSRALLRTHEIFILMEMVDGQTLEEAKLTDFGRLCRLAIQAAQGLHYMHENKYVHADIKPNNLMVASDDQIKIIDFGQSCPVGTIKPRIQGTPDYIAPEQVRKQAITRKTDVFNLGASLYRLTTGKCIPTLIPKGQPGMGLRIEEKVVPPIEVNPNVPIALSSLILDCIKEQPVDRPENMKRVIERLQIAEKQFERDGKDNG